MFFLLICIFSVFVILGVYFSTISFDLVRLNYLNKEQILNYELKVSLYLYGFLKIFSVSFEKGYIKFLNFKFRIKSYKKVSFTKYLDKVKNIKINLKKFKAVAKLGLFDIQSTVLAIPFVSALVSFVLSKFYNDKFKENYSYSILPEYNNGLYVKLHCSGIINVNLVNIINIFFIKERKK